VEDRVFVGGGCGFISTSASGDWRFRADRLSARMPPFVIAAERNGVAGLNVVGLRRAGPGACRSVGVRGPSTCSTAAATTSQPAAAGAVTWARTGALLTSRAAARLCDFSLAPRREYDGD
jgi:hypothetical protein